MTRYKPYDASLILNHGFDRYVEGTIFGRYNLNCPCANGNGANEVDGIDLGFYSDSSVRLGVEATTGVKPTPYVPWGPATEYVKEARERRLNIIVDPLKRRRAAPKRQKLHHSDEWVAYYEAKLRARDGYQEKDAIYRWKHFMGDGTENG